MRPIRRLTANFPLRGVTLLALALGFFVTACSVPDIRIDKKRRTATSETVASFSSKPGSEPTKKDKRYLATVHIRFSDAKDASAISFDINRDKRRLIAAKLWESEETTTTVNLGYTGDGPEVGFKFNWRF